MNIHIQGPPGSVPALAVMVLIPVVLLVLFVGLPWLLLRIWRRRVRRRGYPGLKAYLYHLPQTDEEKIDAVELSLKGLVICVLGILFPVAVPFGLVPLYYGLRKIGGAVAGVGGLGPTARDESLS